MRYSDCSVSAARWALALLVVLASWHPAPATAQSPPAALSRERVTFKSGTLTPVGFLFKLDGSAFFAGALC